MHVVVKILLKALANLPHTDFVLCKCLLSQEVLDEPQVIFGLNLGIELFNSILSWDLPIFQVKTLLYLADLLEMCQFKVFWQQIHAQVNRVF